MSFHLGLASLHNHMSQFLIIIYLSIYPSIYLSSIYLLVLFLWRALTDTGAQEWEGREECTRWGRRE
jgi:hypothetical protein